IADRPASRSACTGACSSASLSLLRRSAVIRTTKSRAARLRSRGRGCDARGVMFAPIVSRPQRALVEGGALAALYGIYEVVRGAGDASIAVARDHTHDIVSLERALHVFGERTVQEWSRGVPFLPALLGVAYMTLHFGVTTLGMRWIYRNRKDAFPLVRTTL